jgi:hypothetical protein
VTAPCGNTSRFESLEKSVGKIEANSETAVSSQQKVAEDHKVLAIEMRGFMSEIRERTVRTDQRTQEHHEGLRVLFQRVNKITETDLPSLKDDIGRAKAANEVRSKGIENAMADIVSQRIMPIEIKHLKEDGAAAAFKDIKVLVPSLLATGLAVLSLWEKIGPWLAKTLH